MSCSMFEHPMLTVPGDLCGGEMTQRLVLLDSDMLCVRNMDELLEMPMEPDWVAAAHACTCNPRKLAHYPKDW